MNRSCGFQVISKVAFGLYVEFHGLDHVLGSENRVKVFLAQDVVFKHKVVYALSGGESLFGNLGGVLVADYRVECRYNTDAVAGLGAAMLFVCRDSFIDKKVKS